MYGFGIRSPFSQSLTSVPLNLKNLLARGVYCLFILAVFIGFLLSVLEFQKEGPGVDGERMPSVGRASFNKRVDV